MIGDGASDPQYAARVHEQAKALIDDYIRPLVEADGGKIDLLEATAGRVVIRLSGTCFGCPGQPYTIAGVIEPAFKKALGPDIIVETRIGSAETPSRPS